MNKISAKITFCLTILLLMFITSGKAMAQCDDLTLSLTKTNSTCLSNGTIKVTVSGSSLANINQSSLQFEVSGSKTIAFSPYANNTIEHLPAGTYTIKLRAFCNVTNDWIVSTSEATTTITSTYREMNFSLGRPIATLNCKNTGIIPVIIESGTGTAPFTITITSKPAAYTGTTVFTSSSRNFDISNLPEGNYTVKVVDDCGYTVENRTAAVTKREQDYYNVFYTYLYPQNFTSCNMVRTQRDYPLNSTDPDGYYYFNTKVSEFFEVAFLFNNTGTKVWQPLTTGNVNMTLPSPYSYKKMREENAYYAVYLRVKGCTTEHRIQDLKLQPNPAVSLTTTAVCDVLNISFNTYSDYDGTFCYPYRWRIVRSDNTVFLDWQGPVSNTNSQTASNVPVGSTVQFMDNEGFTWSRYTINSIPKPNVNTYIHAGTSLLEPDGLYRSYVRLYFNSTFPVGTTFKYLSGPIPIHQTGTLTAASKYIYPYSSSFTSSSYTRMEPGIYKFTITRPGCTPDTISNTHSVYKLASKPTYTTTEECDGLLVKFTGGGQLQYHSYSGTVTNTGTPYIRVSGSVPSGLPYNNQITVTHGGSLKLPQAGKYIISLASGSSAGATEIYRDTIEYTPTPFTLDHSVTSAYLCQGESTGFIRVKGSGGKGSYKYELYDGASLKYTNTTGVFSYGVAGGTYRIVLYDTECGNSYPQDVTLVDLGIAQIAYSGSPDNKFCTSDSIYLKCLTLGETSYTWTGPGINTTNPASPSHKNKQNPVIAASDLGVGTYTYTITVTPESCGTEMTQTVTIMVEDCEGARDDYHSMLMNMTESVDVLANDGYPSSCAGSVTPVITVGPTKGTATIVNKKVVYTPNTNFIGKDSLTYSTICSGTTTTAKVYINVLDYPDNIVDATCFIEPPVGVWSFKEIYRSTEGVFEMSIPLVGDIDNDGNVEIVCAGTSIVLNNFSADTIKIFDAVGKKLKHKFPVERFHAGFGTIAMADVDGDGFAEIFVATAENATAGNQGYIYCYKHDGTLKWKSNQVYTTDVARRAFPYLNITDFNGDGIPEILANDRIFNTHNGQLLLDCGLIAGGMDYGTGGGHVSYYGTQTGSKGSFSTIADMDNDGHPELVAGRNIYKIKINSQTNPALNTCEVLRQFNSTRIDIGDGYTAVADLNLDGCPDVIVVRWGANSSVYMYAWDGKTCLLLHSNIVSVPGGSYGGSIPFIGDLDGDGVPEIAFSTTHKLNAYKYNKSLETITAMSWSPLSTSDISGSTTLTLFDFDQDNKMELVYRDMSQLRIIDGTTGVNKKTIICHSWTMNEYPVVADVDGDGHANIIVLGKPAAMSHGNGFLYVFDCDLSVAGATPWAPARKVWNQWGYNAVNINEDLTIPRCQLNPATVFPGSDGVLGTTDDVRPYNGFLLQQTMLGKNGTPLWLTPEGQVTGAHAFSYDIDADSLTVTIEVCNTGDAAFRSPFYITTYRNSIGGSPKHTYAYNNNIYPGDTVSITFGIPNFKQNWYPFNNLIIQINDNGDGLSDQSVCDDSNRSLQTTNIIASDDRILVFTDDVNRQLEVTLNDILPTGCTNPTVQILSSPSYTGTASVSGSNILYTPTAGATGDTLRYRVHCGDVSKVDTATVYISIVPKPDNISDAECYVDPVGFDWAIKEGFVSTETNVSTYVTPLVGDLDDDGIPEIIVGRYSVGNTYDGIYTYWGHDRANPTLKVLPAFNYATQISIAKVKINGNLQPILVRQDPSGHLIAYDLDPAHTTAATSQIWKSSHPLNDFNANHTYNIGFVDFDGDGELEIYAGNRIFNASTGVLLAEIPAGGNKGARYIPTVSGSYIYFTIAADVTDDGNPELIAGTEAYSVKITNRVGTSGNEVTLISSIPAVTFGSYTLKDGATVVADINQDGRLDVIVCAPLVNSPPSCRYGLFAWDVQTQTLIAKSDEIAAYNNVGIPLVGNIDDEPNLELLVTTTTSSAVGRIDGFRWDGNQGFSRVYTTNTTDRSGSTGITLFDFNQDGKMELVYRDEENFRIMEAVAATGTLDDLATIPARAGTSFEYPVIADIDNDGAAEIIVTGAVTVPVTQGTLRIYRSGNEFNWAPARKVWNQYAYNVVNINEDLTVPKHQLNPATVFPGDDGVLGTADDVCPYNAFLQQQTTLSKNGTPLWLTPDAYPDPTLISSSVVGDSVSITVGILNKGDAAIGSPVYVSLYQESISAANYMLTDSADIQVNPGDTGYVVVRIPDMSLYPATNIVIRVNDRNKIFTYQAECDDTNNTTTILNPAMHMFMKKDATLLLSPPVQHNGTLPNPVAVLYTEKIKYEITAVNVSAVTAPIQIRDTLPAYLKYDGAPDPSTNFVKSVTASGVPVRDIVTWTIPNVAAGATTKVSFEATPVDGACASQPLYINKAWITVGGLQIPTGNSTYHQGAGVGIATFSAGLGGQLYNAEPQAVDYRTAARSGVLVVPDDGYQFDGWSHEAYTSLRGDKIESRDGVMNYDTLTIFGNVELQAHFSPEAYPVRYYLNGADNAESNPETYTVKSGMLTLEAPEKTGDVFTGWTGSNGEQPQATVTIPEGSTGELEFYANFLYSGRESDDVAKVILDDRIWAFNGELYIRTQKIGSMVRVYSVEGMLIHQQEIKTAGETKIRLPQNLYIVTLNNDIGRKIRID